VIIALHDNNNNNNNKQIFQNAKLQKSVLKVQAVMSKTQLKKSIEHQSEVSK